MGAEFSGWLAVLYGNIAEDGCIVKTAGVPEECLTFTGKARIFQSEEEALKRILDGTVKKGDVIVVRYEGPKGGPGMREMLSPTGAIMGKGMGQDVAFLRQHVEVIVLEDTLLSVERGRPSRS